MLSFMGGIGWISLKAGRHWYKGVYPLLWTLDFLLLTHRCVMIKEQISFPGPQQLKVETKGIFKNCVSRNYINKNFKSDNLIEYHNSEKLAINSIPILPFEPFSVKKMNNG